MSLLYVVDLCTMQYECNATKYPIKCYTNKMKTNTQMLSLGCNDDAIVFKMTKNPWGKSYVFKLEQFLD